MALACLRQMLFNVAQFVYQAIVDEQLVHVTDDSLFGLHSSSNVVGTGYGAQFIPSLDAMQLHGGDMVELSSVTSDLDLLGMACSIELYFDKK